MWRSFFVGIGIFMIILGIQFLLVDSYTLTGGSEPKQPQSSGFLFRSTPALVETKKNFRPADWMPWSLLAAGAVVMLYAKSIRAGAAPNP